MFSYLNLIQPYVFRTIFDWWGYWVSDRLSDSDKIISLDEFHGLNLNVVILNTNIPANSTCSSLENWTLGDFWFWLQNVKSLEVINCHSHSQQDNNEQTENQLFLDSSGNWGHRANCYLEIWREANTVNHSWDLLTWSRHHWSNKLLRTLRQ